MITCLIIAMLCVGCGGQESEADIPEESTNDTAEQAEPETSPTADESKETASIIDFTDLTGSKWQYTNNDTGSKVEFEIIAISNEEIKYKQTDEYGSWVNTDIIRGINKDTNKIAFATPYYGEDESYQGPPYSYFEHSLTFNSHDSAVMYDSGHDEGSEYILQRIN